MILHIENHFLKIFFHQLLSIYFFTAVRITQPLCTGRSSFDFKNLHQMTRYLKLKWIIIYRSTSIPTHKEILYFTLTQHVF